MTKLRIARKQRGLTVYDVADRVGLTAGAVSRIERGLLGASPAKARLLANVLGVDVLDVIFNKEEKAA